MAIFGGPATYTAPAEDAEPVACSAHVERDVLIGPGEGFHSAVTEKRTLVWLRVAEVGTPVRDAAIVKGPETFIVDRLIASDGILAQVVVK